MFISSLVCCLHVYVVSLSNVITSWVSGHSRIQVALSALTCRFLPFESWEISCGLLSDVP